MPRTVLPALADPVFALQVMPDAAIAHPAWRRARAAALDALASGSHVVLTGPPGSGKSLLLRNLAHTLRQAGKPVHLIGQAGVSGDALAGGILLVDEADTLGADALAVLCAGAGPVLLAMLPGGAERLPRHPHPARDVVLDRLAPLEVAAFVAARLAAAGRAGDFLEPEAVLALARHSGGLPRMVNVLGGAAVFLAGLDGSPQVSLRHVDEAAAMRDDPAGDAAAPMLTPARPTTPSAPLFPALPSPRASLLRRRAALGGMVAASGILFALPWLRAKPLGGVPQDGAGQMAQAVQPQALQADAEYDVDADAPPSTVADGGLAEPPGAGGTPASLEEQPLVADAALPPQPASPLRADPAPSAVPPDDRRAVVADAPVLFRGPIFNETMKQGGHVRMVLHKHASTGAITARFDASQGLSGTGVLAGRVSENGRITASGQLMMGRNPFLCDLSGTLNGNTLTGSASFVRNGSRMVYHSRFNLVRT